MDINRNYGYNNSKFIPKVLRFDSLHVLDITGYKPTEKRDISVEADVKYKDPFKEMTREKTIKDYWHRRYDLIKITIKKRCNLHLLFNGYF